MNVALWVVACVAGAISLAAATNKLGLSKENLLKQENNGWAEDFSERSIKIIGALEFIGVFGLIVPEGAHKAEILTPIAAVGLALLQVGAAITHIRRREYQVLAINVPLILALTYVAVGRFLHG